MARRSQRYTLRETRSVTKNPLPRRSVLTENNAKVSGSDDEICTRTPRRICKDIAIARIKASQESPLAYDDFVMSQITKPKTTCDIDSGLPSCLHRKFLDLPVKRLSHLNLSPTRSAPRRSNRVISANDKRTSNTPKIVESEDNSSDDSSYCGTGTSSSDTTSDCSFRRNRTPCRRFSLKPGRGGYKTPIKFLNSTKTPVTLPRRALQTVDDSKLNKSFKFDESEFTDALPGREQEFENIFNFTTNKLSQNIGGCMYISGIPGTGKTASVQAVLSTMSKLVKSNKCNVLPTFQTIYVNGMQVNHPRQVYVSIYEQLNGQSPSVKNAAQLLERQFTPSGMNKLGRSVVLVIDELDLLCTRRQDVLYSLFDWPAKSNCPHAIIIIAIANTMDLPERLFHPRVISRMGLTRLTFAPYSHGQLTQIVKHHLSENSSHIFEPKALELAARKVAAVSGDVRRAIAICRRAVEIADTNQTQSHQEIGIEHVNIALKEVFAAPKSMAIRSSSLYEKLFLRAIVAEFQARSAEEIRLDRCIHQMEALCRLEGMLCPSTSEVFAICGSLGAHKLLLCEGSRHDTSLLVRLNCTKSDILCALSETL